MRDLSGRWFITETGVALSGGQHPVPEWFETICKERRERLRPRVKETLALLETGADDDGAIKAAKGLWIAMDDPGRREFLRWCYCNMDVLGRRPFSRIFSQTWTRPRTTSLRGWGFPYRDIVKMFDRALPDVLMEPEDLAVFNQLPAEIVAYRGVAGITIGRAERGMSWTLNREEAEWFAERDEDLGAPMVLEATIRKPNVLAVFNDPEREIVVRPGRVSRVTVQALNSRFHPEAA